MYDLVVKSGLLIDPSQGIHALKDVAVASGKVAAVEDEVDVREAREVLDASGGIVAPGLIDFHVHVYHGVVPLGVEPDATCLATGVTTALDVGSAGEVIFPGFKRFIIDACKTRVYALLNVDPLGLLPHRRDRVDRLIDVDATVTVIEKYKGTILGVKWHSTSGIEALVKARHVCDLAGCFLMCENSAYFWFPMGSLLDYLKKGDVLTHAFQGGPGPGILDAKGDVRDEAWEAYKRGVIFDVGHGGASFSFDVAEAALRQGLLPGAISTDLHTSSIKGPVYDMLTTMSKYLMLGLPLDEVILRSTATPAEALGQKGSLGTLKVGAIADLAILRVMEGEFTFADANTSKPPKARERVGRQKLVLDRVVHGGRIL